MQIIYSKDLHMARPKNGTTFWDRVYPFVKNEGDCLIFTGCRDDCGYGRITRDGRLVRIHREVWIKNNGAIPEGKEICHTCDNPACINPDHLWAGTHLENMQDRSAKGRQARLFGNTHTRGKSINRGSKHGRSKFTEEQVKAIKSSLSVNKTWGNVIALAAEYGVSRTAINHIRAGTRWSHVI